jgi:hypothetical protein
MALPLLLFDSPEDTMTPCKWADFRAVLAASVLHGRNLRQVTWNDPAGAGFREPECPNLPRVGWHDGCLNLVCGNPCRASHLLGLGLFWKEDIELNLTAYDKLPADISGRFG